MKKDLKLVFLGPQGSGKGTQAKMFAKKYGYKTFGMGDLLREVAEKDSELGKKVDEILDAGDLVPNEITFDIIKAKMSELEVGGFIMEGFPRNLEQATVFDALVDLDAVVEFSLPEEESLNRLLYRLVCPNGHIYNEKTLKPKMEGKCDVDGLFLTRRDDDTEESIRNRLKIYHTDTRQVLDHYQKINKLVTVDGEQKIEMVALELEEKLSEL